jgi:hypothetical protein
VTEKSKEMLIVLLLVCALLLGQSGVCFAMGAVQMEQTMRAFAEKFDQNNLEEVMNFFSEDATYRTIEGDLVYGKESIHKELAPQFQGAYGRMTFEVTDVLIDAPSKKIILVWTCHHDFSHTAVGFKNNMTRFAYKLFSGTRAYWYGLDIFELNEEGLIISKSSYTTSKIPRMFPSESQP